VNLVESIRNISNDSTAHTVKSFAGEKNRGPVLLQADDKAVS